MNIVDLRTYRDPKYIPTVIFVDLQKEYLLSQRALALRSAHQAVENCKKLLSFARLKGFPIANIRWSQNGKFFNKRSKYSQWIDGFSPSGSDMIFERSKPSCYSSDSFAEMMDHGGGANALIAGFTGTIACLSTIIDAYHRGHKVTFISDASASHCTDNISEESMHAAVSGIISIYATSMTTTEWISKFSHRDRVAGRM